MKRIVYLLTLFLALAVFAGCSSEPRGEKIHDPGVYKGKQDPVLALKNQQELVNRLKLIQTDR